MPLKILGNVADPENANRLCIIAQKFAGELFAGYYREAWKCSPEHRICLEVVRDEPLNLKIYLDLADRRWRQEDPKNSSVFTPVIPNQFTFKHLRITPFA